MSRRLSRISLVLVLFLSSEVWALGLGDIRLESALGEPLRAEIVLLSATPDELDNLTVAMASADTFRRYGLDRPFYLQGLQFQVVRSGRADGNVVRVRSESPMAEPFLTFLVEATWSRGRLLREYTLLLDPPTYAPPSRDTAQAVQAPSRTAPADSGQIQRPAPTPAPTPQPEQRPTPAPRPAPAPARPAAPVEETPPPPVVDERPFATAAGGDLLVQRGETLWGIASRVRPDSRLTMNQTMLAIFEANPAAFGGNINILRAGASLRVPSADDIFRINRADALAEAQRQHAAWGGGRAVAPAADTRPSLTLVPPDDDYLDDTTAPVDTGYDTEPYGAEPLTREDEILQRIAEIEAADVPDQVSLIEIRDNELAQLRQELAEIRGEIYEPPVDEEPVMDDADIFADDADTVADDAVADDADTVADDAETPSTIIQTPTSTRRGEPGLVERILGVLTEWWMIIVGVVVIVAGALFWFMRRGGGDHEPEAWQPLDSDEAAATMTSTESIPAPAGDESIVVVEQESTIETPAVAETVESEIPPFAEPPEESDTGTFGSLEDTFSSETAVNLDQSDPIAEADFHMAYGLYDQAADLVNGALEIEPQRHDLLTKLCEIYFVWGNRDAFVDAAGKLKAAVGDAESADWDKIVIMGQQIAADDQLFSGASAAGATRAVDLDFEAGGEDTGALDMELVADSDAGADILDIGAADADDTAAAPAADGGEGVDFVLDTTGESEAIADDDSAVASVDFDFVEESPTVESPTVESAPDFDITKEMPQADATAEMPTVESPLDSPTIEDQFDALAGTSELPSLDDTAGGAVAGAGQGADETAEINLDDLDLDVDGLAETELASLDDLDATGELGALEDTGINEALGADTSITGKNLGIDPDATGTQAVLGADDTGINEALGDVTLGGTTMNEALDESLLDATGVTQVLSSDLAVDTATDVTAQLRGDDATLLAGLDDETTEVSIGDDQETMLAGLDDDVGDFDFAKTEALPKEAFTGDSALDETGEMPAVASTDVDLDLDDLTAALQVSEAAGDTIEQPRDDATVEQPRPVAPEDAPTQEIAPEDMSDDLQEARTMTEVGTKLDLARAYVDMGDPSGARSILEEVLDEGDEAQRQQAQQLLDSLPS